MMTGTRTTSHCVVRPPTYTLDANIFTRTLHPNQSNHAVCGELIAQLSTSNIPIIVPLILLTEVSGAVRRETGAAMQARIFADVVRGLPTIQLVPIDSFLADVAADIASDEALRGMDALYVAVARQYGCALVTLDREVQLRAARVVSVLTPTAALSALFGPA